MTTIERYILESIQKGNQTAYSIHRDTELEPHHIEKLLRNLIKNKQIEKRKNLYHLIVETSKTKSTLKALEFSIIIKNCIRNSFRLKDSKEFKMKKVYLSSEDEKVYQSMLFNLESFLDHASKKKGQTAKEKMIYWGEKTYQNIVNELYNPHSIT